MIRVYIAEDHTIVRKGIRALLAAEEDISVVGEASDGLKAVEEAGKLRPDVVLMDLVMPNLDGVEATRQIAAGQTGTRVLVLTSFATDDKVFPALKAGALGYLLKDAESDDLAQAIRLVHRGESSLHPRIAHMVLRELNHSQGPSSTLQRLTEREGQVLRLLAQGLSNQEIADRLVLSVTTVHTHVNKILSKLHLSSRTQAALYALREGLSPSGGGEYAI